MSDPPGAHWNLLHPAIRLTVSRDTKKVMFRVAAMKNMSVSALLQPVIDAWARKELTKELKKLEAAKSTKALLSAVEEITPASWRGLMDLARIESALLLALSSGRVCSRTYLYDCMQAVKPLDNDRSESALSVAILRLRMKLRPLKITVISVPAIGYRLDEKDVPILAARRII